MHDILAAAIITAIALLGIAFCLDSGQIYGVKPGWEDRLFIGFWVFALVAMWGIVLLRAVG